MSIDWRISYCSPKTSNSSRLLKNNNKKRFRQKEALWTVKYVAIKWVWSHNKYQISLIYFNFCYLSVISGNPHRHQKATHHSFLNHTFVSVFDLQNHHVLFNSCIKKINLYDRNISFSSPIMKHLLLLTSTSLCLEILTGSKNITITSSLLKCNMAHTYMPQVGTYQNAHATFSQITCWISKPLNFEKFQKKVQPQVHVPAIAWKAEAEQ